MQQFSLCFGKVKKDCLKFIKSQETKADKFKNKEKMIKSFLTLSKHKLNFCMKIIFYLKDDFDRR